MKILIDLTCLSSSMTGVRRYAACITEEILKIDQKNKYILLFRNSIYPLFLPYLKKQEIKIIKSNNNIIFKLFKLPIELYKIKADKYLFLYSKAPLFFYNKNVYNTIHDLVCWDYPHSMSFPQKIHSKLLNRQAAKNSKYIFTVSNFTKERIIKLLKYPEEKILVTYEGISNSLKDTSIAFQTIKNKYNLPNKYIMNLSTMEPRKNLQLLIKTYDEIAPFVDYDLVLVGKSNSKINKLINSAHNNTRIHLTGFIKDSDVAPIYKNSICFVFSSLYEGFGLPPLEALSFGTPVLSSDSGSLPEILRKQARYFKNNDMLSLKEELLNLNNNLSIMAKSLDDYQKENYSFLTAAKKILDIIN